MRLVRCWRLGLGAAIALSVSLAFAAPDSNLYPECTRKPTAADLDGAKGAHKAASQFYERGDYEKAIRYWTDAYGFDCNAHGVLINIANSFEKKGDKAAAVVALETYLKRAGNDPNMEEKLKNLKASMPAPKATAPVPTAEPTAAPSAAPTAMPTAPVPDGPRPYGYKPWIVVGAGAAVAAAGGVLLPIGLGKVAEAEKACPPPNHTCPNDANLQKNVDTGNTGRLLKGVGIATLAAGGATLLGGLVWQLALNKPEASAKTGRAAPRGKVKAAVRVVPAIGPNDTGVIVTGSF